ncbi:MAG: DUF945 family protein [Woeseiaceae bacterium]
MAKLMRKTLLFVSTLLIIIALGGPAIIGHFLERAATEQHATLENAMPPWAEIVSKDYERGWFGAASQYRILITEEAPAGVRELLGAFGEFGDQPAIIVASQISHGPLVGVFRPAVVRVSSLFFLDTGDGDPVSLPLATQLHVGFGGGLSVDWELAKAQLLNNGLTLDWAPVTGRLAAKSGQKQFEGSFSASAISIAPTNAASTPALEIRDAQIETIVTINDTLINTDIDYDVTFEDNATRRFDGNLEIDRLAGIAMPGLERMIESVQNSTQPVDWRAIGARHLDTLYTLTTTSPTIDWTQAMITAEGQTDSDLHIDVAPEPIVKSINIDTFINDLGQKATGRLQFSAPVERVENMALNSPFMSTIRGMGMLEKNADKDRYQTEMSYARGMLNVNGLPMPLMPASR